MESYPSAFQRRQPWSIHDIPFGSIDRDRVKQDMNLFYLLTSASFVEITSDLYTRNLVDFFCGDEEVQGWLERVWQYDEIRHGLALKRYVNTVWPRFDWHRAYGRFVAEYSRFCKRERLESSRALEMASRCLVETGTATLYTMVLRLSPDPVLRLLADRISKDEVRHYKHFYSYFLRYRNEEKTGTFDVMRVLWRRIAKIDDEDAFYAFKHAFQEYRPTRFFNDSNYEAFRSYCSLLAKRYYPFSMAIKMFLKPLGLNAPVKRTLVPVFIVGVRYLCKFTNFSPGCHRRA